MPNLWYNQALYQYLKFLFSIDAQLTNPPLSRDQRAWISSR